MALTVLVVLVGSAACTGPTSRPGPPTSPAPEPSAAPGWQRTGAWNSATSGSRHAEVTVPGGRRIHLRLRCAGSGDFAVRVSGETFADDYRIVCDGRWQFLQGSIPPGADPPDPGPYRAAVSGSDTITSWDLEAYETDPSAPPST